MLYFILSTILFLLALIIIYWIHNQYHLDIVVTPVPAPTSAPKVSVCIPARNEETNIRRWEGYIGFTESKITKVLARGNRQVPEVSYTVCERIGLRTKDIDLLVTNQPNRAFLRNWCEALELPSTRHVHTFDECGNLFAAGIPVNLDRAIQNGHVSPGDTVLMAAFAHAGDFAAAAAVRWGGRPTWNS